MTKAVADSAGVDMPSFGGYLRWSAMYLIPILAAMVAIFIADGLIWTIVGLLLAGAIAARALWLARHHVHPSEQDA